MEHALRLAKLELREQCWVHVSAQRLEGISSLMPEEAQSDVLDVAQFVASSKTEDFGREGTPGCSYAAQALARDLFPGAKVLVSDGSPKTEGAVTGEGTAKARGW